MALDRQCAKKMTFDNIRKILGRGFEFEIQWPPLLTLLLSNIVWYLSRFREDTIHMYILM